MISYRKATKEDLKKISEIIATSFEEYPLYGKLKSNCKSNYEYQKLLYEMHIVFFKAHLKKGHLLVGVLDNQICSVALLEEPKARNIGIFAYIRYGGLRLLKYISISKLFECLKLIEKSSASCHGHKDENWYLAIYAVKKSFQGKQIGSKMLNDCIIPYIKNNHGSAISLITNTMENCKFYTKNGFKEFDSRRLDAEGQVLMNWSFMKYI